MGREGWGVQAGSSGQASNVSLWRGANWLGAALVGFSFKHHDELEDSRPFPQHHVYKVSVGDGVTDSSCHLRDHLLHLQVGLGDTKLLHHPL